jgi:SAM-dependent methyltransferase
MGGVFVGLAAPALFSGYAELPLAVVGSDYLALVLVYGVRSKGGLIRLAIVTLATLVVASNFHQGSTPVAKGRNFYGTFLVQDKVENGVAVRTLYNGQTLHGAEFLSDQRRGIPTAYYGRRSGLGRLFEAMPAGPRRVAIVGLGAGMLAAYGRKGDVFRFYDINPAVIEAARAYFHFLGDSPAAVEVVQGDGRLRLAEEAPGSLDLIVLDAFSGDAIPVHLLTREAFQLYFDKLRSGGPLAVHISNRYVDLGPVVQSLARVYRKQAIRFVTDGARGDQTLDTDWMIVGESGALMDGLERMGRSAAVKDGPLWTDDYSNLLQVLR